MAVATSAIPPAPRVLEIDPQAELGAPDVRADALDAVENGRILFLPKVGFELTARERDLILDREVILPGQKERESQTGRPTLIFDPDRGRIERTKIRGGARRELEAMMQRFAAWANDVVSMLLPSYSGALESERVTYRPCDRSIPQGLHIDNSYTRPTQGRGMLRVFCNISPLGRPRVWQVGEPFEPFVTHFLPSARMPRAASGWLLHRLGITRGMQSPYDRLIADIRRLAKSDDQYQRVAPRTLVEFPSGSSWLAITDLTVHGAISGQDSLDRNFFLPVEAMADASRSSLRILERLTGRVLV